MSIEPLENHLLHERGGERGREKERGEGGEGRGGRGGGWAGKVGFDKKIKIISCYLTGEQGFLKANEKLDVKYFLFPLPIHLSDVFNLRTFFQKLEVSKGRCVETYVRS